jgi:plastocyanin
MHRLRNAVIGAATLLIAGGTAAQIHHTYAASPAATKQVVATEKNNKYLFSPKSITVSVGTKVVWKNTSDAAHTVTGTAGNAKFKAYNAKLLAGKSVSFTFSKAGTYKYYCSIHPYMKGTVTVR